MVELKFVKTLCEQKTFCKQKTIIYTDEEADSFNNRFRLLYVEEEAKNYFPMFKVNVALVESQSECKIF